MRTKHAFILISMTSSLLVLHGELRAEEGNHPCYGNIVVHTNCDDLNKTNTGKAVWCLVVASDPNGTHNCLAVLNPGVGTHTCQLGATSSCHRYSGITAGDPQNNFCYQECGANSIVPTGYNCVPFTAYGTSSEEAGTPACDPDFDECIKEEPSRVYVHWDCYPGCYDWVIIGEGVEVPIPGASADETGCDPLPPELLPVGGTIPRLSRSLRTKS